MIINYLYFFITKKNILLQKCPNLAVFEKKVPKTRKNEMRP